MRTSLALLASVLALQACSKEKAAESDSTAAATPAATTPAAPGARADSTPSAATATAPMKNAAGRDLGTLTLTDTPQGIMVMGNLTGLTPGEHGVHIHTVGQCQPPFTSAGAHWNPTNRQHGSLNPQGPHLGDMPNITVAADSSASVHLTTATGGTLHGANLVMDVDGASVVVHTKADDLRTDPSGNSGDRVACGVVTAG